MKTVNRILVIVLLGIVVVLGWAGVARTDWAATRDILGAGEAFSHPLEPVIKIAAVLLIAVAGTKLVERGFRYLRGTGRSPEQKPPVAPAGSIPGHRPGHDRFREEVLGLPPLPTRRPTS